MHEASCADIPETYLTGRYWSPSDVGPGSWPGRIRTRDRFSAAFFARQPMSLSCRWLI